MSRTRGVSASALVLAVALALAGCSSADESREKRATPGEFTRVSASAVDPDFVVDVPLPTGVLHLGIDRDVGGRAGDDGVVALGLHWSLDPHPSSDARDAMLAGLAMDDLDDPVVVVPDGDERVEVPAAVRDGAGVIGVREALAIEIEFDGLSQAIDIGSGELESTQAAAFADLSASERVLRRACAAGDFPPTAVLDHGCQVESVIRLPYLAGQGWAPGGQSWLVVDVRIEGRADVLLDGKAGESLANPSPRVQRMAFVVANGTPRSVDFDFGRGIGVVSVPIGS